MAPKKFKRLSLKERTIIETLLKENMKKDSVIKAGNNVVWDFSNTFESTQIDTLLAIDPSTTIFYNDPHTNYSLSNLCLFQKGMPYSYDDNLYSYYISNESSVEFIGSWADNPIWESWYYHLTDTEKLFEFPFSLNDYFQDSFYGSSYDMSGSGLHIYQGIRSVEADGFGTLVLPSTVYTNCLRIKATRTYSDSSTSFGVNQQIYFEYSWFQLARNGPIIELKTDTGFYNMPTKYYYNNPLVGLSELHKKDNDVIVSPNPFSNRISIRINKPDAKKILFQFRDVLGKVIFMQTNDDIRYPYTAIIYPGDIPIGIYFLEIIVDRERIIKKIVKQL